MPDGGYEKEESEVINRRIGEPFDDVSLETVFTAIVQQMARRDAWVTVKEIFEYKKNKVTFRETDGGMVIKNRKFLLDQGANLVLQELKSVEIQETNGHTNHTQLIDPGPIPPMPVMRPAVPMADPNRSPVEQPNPNRRVKKWVVFQPELPQLAEARQKGLKCTEGKKYPVFEEKEHPMGYTFGQVYTIMDDMRREIQCSDKYFSDQVAIRLLNDINGEFSNPNSSNDGGGGRLIWPGEIAEQQTVPDVRRAVARGEKLPPQPGMGFDDGMGGGNDVPMPDIRRGKK